MALNLEELKFVVDTTELDAAAKKIGALGDALNKVNKPVKESAANAEKLAQAQAKIELATAKAALAAEKMNKAQNETVGSSKAQVSILEKQIMVLEYMAQGHSRGQASMMATAKVAGAVSTEIEALSNTLKTQRTLMGTDPFDKSIGALESWSNKVKVATEVEQLYKQGLGLTKTQMQELAIEKQRLIALAAMEGKSIQQVEAEYQKIIGVAANLAQKQNTITSTIKQQDKALSDAAKATAYLADADARLAAALDVTNAKLDKAGSDALVKYEKALRQSGMGADEAAAKLAKARTQFDAIADKKQADKLQYLARAISVQMGDVGISLASGMNPLLVMIQQGDQIRGAIQQAGAEGKQLQTAMAGAATQIATSFVQTGQAIGGFFVSAIKSTGAALLGLPLELTRTAFLSMFASADVAAQAFERLKVAAIAFSKVGIVAAIAVIAALGKGLYDVVKQQDALTTQLVLTGGSLGLNAAKANEYAMAMNDVGISTTSALKVIAAMAKEGGFLAADINKVTIAAVELEKYGGVAVEETVKQFAKLKEKPVDALTSIAKATGLVSPEVLKLVSDLEAQGKSSEAAAVAMKAYADVTLAQKDKLKTELSDFALFMKTLSSSVADFFDGVFRDLFRRAAPAEAIKEQIKAIDDLLNNNAGVAGMIIGGAGIGKKAYEEQRAALVEQLKLVGKASDLELTRNSEARKTAAILESVNKGREDSLSKQDKMQRELNKAEKDHDFLIQQGLLKREESEKILQNIRDKYKETKAPKTDAEKEQLRLLRESETYLNKVSSLTNEATKQQEEYTKAQKLALDIFSDPDFKNYPEQQRIKIANALEQAHAEELIANELTKQRAVQKQIYDEYIKLQAERDKAMFDAQDNAVLLNQALKEESDELVLQASLIGKTDEERKRAIKTRQAELILAKDLAAIDKLKSLDNGADITDLRTQAYQRFADRTKNINAEIANDFASQMQKQYDTVIKGLSDSITTALFEGGKAGSKQLRNVITAALREPITIVVKAAVDVASTAISSGLNSMLGGAAGSSLGSTLGAVTGLSSMGAGLGAGWSAAFGEAGLMGGLDAAGVAMSSGNIMAGLGTGIGVVAPYLLALAALPKVMSGLFGSGPEQTGAGITGTLSAGGTSVRNYRSMRDDNGWGRSTDYWREFDKVDTNLQSFLDTATQGYFNSSTKYAKALGLPTEALASVTKQIDIELAGLNPEQQQAKINEALGGFGDELAKRLGLESYQALEQLGKQVLQQRYDLESQLLALQGDTVALRERERSQIYETNRALFDQIKALEDKQAKDEAATKITEEKIKLEQQLAILQGKTTQSAIDRAALLSNENRVIYDQIQALQEKTKAEEERTKAEEAYKTALESTTKTIVDEIARLRGTNTNQAGLEAQFAILTAQARSGDLEALAKLPAITQGLEQIAGATAVNATDIVMARARLAQSLQDTLGYTGANGFSATPSVASVSLSSVSAMGTGATATVSASSSNQELLSALVTEVQGLRAEVRADVSHNAKTAKILERANQDGETLSVSATIDGGVV